MSQAPFTEADLLPTPEERRAARRATVDRVATTAAVLAAGLWLGGLVALGACAAPLVFQLARPFAADAMGATFARFDQVALGCAVVILGAEVARTWAGGRRGRGLAARVRRVAAFLLALGATYGGLQLTPRLNTLHREGARRGEGVDGMELDATHKRAELVGKTELGLGVVLIALHVFTLGARRPDDDEEDDDALAPLPPGPR